MGPGVFERHGRFGPVGECFVQVLDGLFDATGMRAIEFFCQITKDIRPVHQFARIAHRVALFVEVQEHRPARVAGVAEVQAAFDRFAFGI